MPAIARICVGTTAGCHTSPSIHGTSTGASTASAASPGIRIAAVVRTTRSRSANIAVRSVVREYTGKAIACTAEPILR